MIIDNVSDGGSWRRELLARPLSTTELRVIISELEHALAIERKLLAEVQAELKRLRQLVQP